MENYKNLTDGQKQLCYEVISKLLGLKADVTMERITPRVAQKVEEYINETSSCSDRIKDFIFLYRNLLPDGVLKKFTGDIQDAIDKVNEIESKTKNLNIVFAPCFFTTKRRYAQEIQYIFFDEGIGGIY
ncbi:hypothetical protein [Campylobacter fetus]|uniref:hypothetical protein n=1 Tax=Campylobacter fetus TaxID=196 RepID=UPI00122EEA07|nr:hypothetical protein [Campylobacter fetus]KAA3684594.1 hypothetical protein E3U42_09805 [Campylobacter fetus subsp. fetus]